MQIGAGGVVIYRVPRRGIESEWKALTSGWSRVAGWTEMCKWVASVSPRCLVDGPSLKQPGEPKADPHVLG